MQISRIRLMVILGGLLAASSAASAATFNVNSTLDAVDATPGDGICATAGSVCTLRAAIQEANALAGSDTIVVPAGTYTLTIAGINEAVAATGDLDITSTVIIQGAGANVTTVNAAGLDRAFEVIAGGDATLRGLRITGGNQSGIFSRGALTVQQCAIVGNTGNNLGGGVFATLGTVSISDSEVSGNNAISQGGGLNLQNAGGSTLTNVTVSGNTSGNQFAGIVSTSALTITNSTIANNTEGLANARNMIAVGPGATLRNTLFVSPGGTNCSGTITDGGGNFATGAVCGAIPVTAAVATNLGALALNAPGTTSTHALLAGNPAIDGGVAGFCTAADQRGVSRPAGPCDSGAYELVASVSTPTQPTPAPSVLPTISSIANQTLQQNTGVTIPFTISGAVITPALRTTATSSNPTLFPSIGSSLTCDPSGRCTLQLTPADGRGGSAVVTIGVSDGTNTTSQSFTATVTVVRPSAPGVALANVIGSGVALTWTAPESGAPVAYAVAWGTASGASNLPVQLVPGNVGRLDFSSLPSGTYYFRVYAVGAGDVSPASPQTTATVTTSATAPGPPMVLQLTAGAGLTARWSAPIIGFAPTVYEVQIGSGLGLSDVASATTGATSYDAAVSAGTYWVRARAASGGAVGAWSSSVQIPFGSGAGCVSAPPAPTLLPVVTGNGQATLLWLAAGGSTADYYQLQISPGAGLPPVQTVNTPGPATSATWPQVGAYAARVVAINACGASTRSNEVAFVTQP